MTRVEPTALILRRRARRLRFVLRTRIAAAAAGARVTLEFASDLEVGHRVRVQVQRGSRNHLRIGGRCRIGDDVVLMLKGGTLYFGDGVDLRVGGIVKLAGSLRCEGDNVIGYRNVIHCAESVLLRHRAVTAEMVSLIDSTHHHDGPHAHFYDNTTTAPIVVGENTWIGSKATVLLGVTIGADAVVAAHAVVNVDVEDGSVVGGLPARPLGSPSARRFERT